MTSVDRIPTGTVRTMPVNPCDGLFRFTAGEKESVAPALPVDEVIRDFSGCQTLRKRGNLPWPSRLPEIPAKPKGQKKPPVKLETVPIIIADI